MFDLNKLNFGQNLVWFFGVVEDRMDPNFLGRVRVRCFGHHTPNRFEIPTEDLPWAMVMQPVTSAAQTDVGQSPTGIVEGSWVVGFFIDGEEAQQPLVIGSIGGYAHTPDKLNPEDAPDWFAYGFKDVREEHHLENRGFPSPPVNVRKDKDRLGAEIEEDDYVERYPRTESQEYSTVPKLARGVQDRNIFLDEESASVSTIAETNKAMKEPMLSKYLNETRNIQTSRKGVSYNQPTSPYNAVYPFNHVQETESGHIIEYDDTPKAERIHEYHRSGTFREIHPDGKLVSQTMNEKYDIVEADSFEYTKGSKYETYRKGAALLVNAGNFGGEDYEVRVAGSANYNLTVEEGDFTIKVPTGETTFVTNSLKHEALNRILQVTPSLFQINSGDQINEIENNYRIDAGGLYDMTAGSIRLNSKMNSTWGAGDNIHVSAGHTVAIHAENTFTMLPFYIPFPNAVEVTASHGHIEMNAMDGDTRISARGKGWVFDTASLTVTSALPTSIASIAQQQPSPMIEVHPTHPGSIVGQTKTGYIYWQAYFGDIVSEAKFLNSVRTRTTPMGMIEETGGLIVQTSTASNIINNAAVNFMVHANAAVLTHSVAATVIYSETELHAFSGTATRMTSGVDTSIASIGGAVRLGSHAACEPALKGPSFLKAFWSHTHLTAMGPTTPVDLITNPMLATWVAQSLCLKTMVF